MKTVSNEVARVLRAENKPTEKQYSDEFYTPAKYLNALGPFVIDPCAGPNSIATINFDYSQGQCGLSLQWPKGRAFVNPPYSLKGEFLEKLSLHGDGFALVPNSTESIWWQRAANQCSAFLLLQGRVAFQVPTGQKRHSNTKVSTIFAYGPEAVAILEKAVGGGKLHGFLVIK